MTQHFSRSGSSRLRSSGLAAIWVASVALGAGALGTACQMDMVVAADDGDAGSGGSNPDEETPNGESGENSGPLAGGASGVSGANSARAGSGGQGVSPPMSAGGSISVGGGSAGGGGPTTPSLLVPLNERRSLRLNEASFARTLSALLQIPEGELQLSALASFGYELDPSCSGFSKWAELSRAALASRTDEQVLEALDCVEAGPDCIAPLGEFAARAYGRPLAEGEIEALVEEATFGDGLVDVESIRAAVRTILISPEVECLSQAGTLVRDQLYALDNYEMAALLSHTVVDLPPDDELWDAAESDDFSPSEQLDRLAAKPEAREQVARLIRSWVGIPEAKSLWTATSEPELSSSMLGETQRFIEEVVFERDSPFSTLLNANFSFVDARLAELYGLDPVSEFSEVDLSQTRRRGLLHHASYLTATSFDSFASLGGRAVHPLHLMCVMISPPPPDTPAVIREPDQTGREYAEQTMVQAPCASCHSVINPFYLAFEHFDAMGAYRETQAGKPIDASGVTSASGSEIRFEDSADLVEQIALLQATNDCFRMTVRGWFIGTPINEQLGWGRAVTDPAPSVPVLSAMRTFVDSYGFRFRTN